MRSNAFRLCSYLGFGLALLAGTGCPPTSGAQFSPATGVLRIVGTGGADLFEVSVSAGAIVVNGGQVPIRGGTPTVGNTLRIEMRGNGGPDFLELDESGGSLPDALLLGGEGADVLIGGSGDDEIDGGPGDDVALLGDGDDTFVWSYLGGLDTVEGQGGLDTLRFHGDNQAELVYVYANGARAHFFRDADDITTDLDDVEAIDYRAHGGADSIHVGDLGGTDVKQVRIDLRGAGGFGDAEADAIFATGTNGVDSFGVVGDAALVSGFGLPANVQIVGAEAAHDRLTLNALGEADFVDASGLAAGAIGLVLVGGLGNDELIGSEGDDELNGGDGNELAEMGGGDDTFVWNPGDDLDAIVGGAGFDTLLFNGASTNETFELSAVLGRVRMTRSVASIVLDLDAIEAVDLIARSGSDLIFLRDLSTTDLLEVNVDLAGSNGAGDLVQDSVFVDGGPGDDSVQVFGDASEVSVVGLVPEVHIANPEVAFDALGIATFGGDDLVHAASLAAGAIQLTADGGDDHDVLVGSAGPDVLYGGEGDDVLQGGPGLDVLDGGPGDNVVIQ